MLIFRKPLSFKSLQEALEIIFLFVLVYSGCQTTEISHSSAGWGVHEKDAKMVGCVPSYWFITGVFTLSLHIEEGPRDLLKKY